MEAALTNLGRHDDLRGSERERGEKPHRKSANGSGEDVHGFDDLALISPADFGDAAIEPLEWLVPDWIPRRRVTLLQGDGGLGKSTILQQLQSSYATGCAWLGLPVVGVGASIGIYSEEEDRDLRRRQALIDSAYCRLEDRQHHPLMNWLPVQNRPLNKDFLASDQSALITIANGKPFLTDLFWKLCKAAERFEAGLIVLDVAVDLFDADEVRRREVRSFIGTLAALARDIDGAVVLSGHVSQAGLKTDGGHSGSTDWSNAVRSRLYLSRTKDEHGAETDNNARVLTRKKANDASIGDTIKLRWQNGLIVPDAPTAASYLRRPVEDVFLALLDAMTSEGQKLSPKPRAGNYAPAMFMKRPSEDRGGYLRADFERAIQGLLKAQKIKIETYGPPSSDYEKFVRTEPSR